jgi:hypothetical protein
MSASGVSRVCVVVMVVSTGTLGSIIDDMWLSTGAENVVHRSRRWCDVETENPEEP